MRVLPTFPAAVASVKTFISRTFIATFKTHRSNDSRSGFADTFNYIIACKDDTAFKFSKDGTQIFAFVTDGNPVAPPVAFKRIFIADDLYLYCLNEDDGSLLWKVSIDDYALGITANGSEVAVSIEDVCLKVLRYDGSLLFTLTDPKPFGATSEDFSYFIGFSAGSPVLCHIDDDGNILWKASTKLGPTRHNASPTRLTSKIFTSGPVCHSTSDGHIIWDASDAVPSSPTSQCLALSSEKLFYAASDGNLYRMSLNGSVELSADLLLSPPNTDASASDFIYGFGSGIFKFSFELEQIWRYYCNIYDRSPLGLGSDPSQTAHRDVVVVPADEGLLVIDKDGSLLWSHANANLTHPAIY